MNPFESRDKDRPGHQDSWYSQAIERLFRQLLKRMPKGDESHPPSNSGKVLLLVRWNNVHPEFSRGPLKADWDCMAYAVHLDLISFGGKGSQMEAIEGLGFEQEYPQGVHRSPCKLDLADLQRRIHPPPMSVMEVF